MNPLLYIPSVWSPSSFLHTPLFSTVLQHFIDSTQSTREHEGRGSSQTGTAGFLDGIMSQREVRNHKKRDCLFSIANNSRLEKKAQPCWLRKRQQWDLEYISHSLMDHAWRFCEEAELRGNHASKSITWTQGAYENFISKNPCYPVESPPADLLTQPIPQCPRCPTTKPCFHQALE